MSHRMQDAFSPLLMLATLVGCTAEPRSRVAADEDAIRQLIAETVAANNAADTLGWVALFEEGAVYMPPGRPEGTTRPGLERAAAAGFGTYAAEIQITPVEIVVAGDWAFARSRVTGTVTSRADGGVIPVDVKQIAIYTGSRRGNGRLRGS